MNRLLLVVITLLNLSFISSNFWWEPEIPFPNINRLDTCESINGKEVAKGQNVVIISTHMKCKPCLVLAKKLEKELPKNQIAPSQVVYFNGIDYDTDLIESTLQISNYLSPYYRSPNMVFTSSYPGIWAYNKKGELEWSSAGYAKSQVKRIIEHLKQ